MSARLDDVVAGASASLSRSGFVVESVLVLPHGRDDSPPRTARLEFASASTRESYALVVGAGSIEVVWCSVYFRFPALARDVGPLLERVVSGRDGWVSSRRARSDGPRHARNADVARVVAVRALGSVAPLLRGPRTSGPLAVPAALDEVVRASSLPGERADLVTDLLVLRERALARAGELDGLLTDLESGAPLEWALRRAT